MADDLKPGDLVDVTIQGVPVHLKDEYGCIWIVADAYDGGPGHWQMPPQATAERCDPEWWPPRPGDLLRNTSTGRRWFAIATGSSTCLYNDRADLMEPQEAWELRHQLTLVDRENEQDGGGRG
ncbi:hypothetical protein [Actinomadura madurae]|uniref:hypothetical protein n=1 Tax=Actinomadura madurae TaxID=1993 RepID=UPI0020D2212D|nr:hypothetical protein [Actinomadura madurae]MCP9947328.1 hypothetical protein [Actinomadura madurae]MCP9964094.1 hypothetical protein [Actinomadura madurae]MCP9976565.1 hypothetical protein [Actinomadura madurae]MCQ0011937.1 hypothetical protein [Actinomadura madurae]MCQ0012761.1 hypothetical protein [Actinomadura madurae]